MKRKLLTLLLLLAAWMGGYGYGRWYAKAPAKGAAGAERKILYYHDPMHPWYKSDKPGIAPDCGMKLVPVYEGGEQAAVSKPANLGPGAVEITPEKQQLKIGRASCRERV